MIDEILKEQLKSIESDEVAVLLSGGVDSSTLAFTAARLGKRVHGYSFYIGEPSYDSLKAQEICETFGFDFTGVNVPVDNIIEDFKTLAYKYDCKKKTQFECTFPFMYIYPQIKEKYVLSGVAADGHYGLSKRAMIHFRHTKEKFDQFRSDYFSSPNPAGIRQLEMLSKEYDKELIAPYLTREIYDYFQQFTWEEINKPYEKHLIRSRFKEFDEVKVKKHLNLQLVGGVDKVFEGLLESDEINFKNRKRVMDICRDWYEKTQQSDLSALLS
jgi:asparagine synthetase B (glutamine-hydrolysing)